MIRYIRELCIILVFQSVLLSCAGSPSVSKSEVISDESSVGYRSSENASNNQMITYSVSLRLSVKNTGETKKILVEQINNNNGFIVRETDDYITTRIPYENMENFLNNARTLGKIENETKTGIGITDQYRDGNIRLDFLLTISRNQMAFCVEIRKIAL